jgi:hypothetical protein
VGYDSGCCGGGLRRMMSLGFPVENVILFSLCVL